MADEHGGVEVLEKSTASADEAGGSRRLRQSNGVPWLVAAAAGVRGFRAGQTSEREIGEGTTEHA